MCRWGDSLINPKKSVILSGAKDLSPDTRGSQISFASFGMTVSSYDTFSFFSPASISALFARALPWIICGVPPPRP